MTVPVIHEASEIESTTLDGCPLAIEAEEKVFDKPEIEYDRPIPLPDVRNCPLEDGYWEGERDRKSVV